MIRFGDELVLHAAPEYLSLSVAGSAKTAYCCFKFRRGFFEPGYRVDADEEEQVVGMMPGKVYVFDVLFSSLFAH